MGQSCNCATDMQNAVEQEGPQAAPIPVTSICTLRTEVQRGDVYMDFSRACSYVVAQAGLELTVLVEQQNVGKRTGVAVGPL